MLICIQYNECDEYISRQFQLKNGNFFRAKYKYIQNLQTLQGYIFRILQHFATKLCYSTNFKILFLAVAKRFRSSCLVRLLVYYANCHYNTCFHIPWWWFQKRIKTHIYGFIEDHLKVKRKKIFINSIYINYLLMFEYRVCYCYTYTHVTMQVTCKKIYD